MKTKTVLYKQNKVNKPRNWTKISKKLVEDKLNLVFDKLFMLESN